MGQRARRRVQSERNEWGWDRAIGIVAVVLTAVTTLPTQGVARGLLFTAAAVLVAASLMVYGRGRSDKDAHRRNWVVGSVICGVGAAACLGIAIAWPSHAGPSTQDTTKQVACAVYREFLSDDATVRQAEQGHDAPIDAYTVISEHADGVAGDVGELKHLSPGAYATVEQTFHELTDKIGWLAASYDPQEFEAASHSLVAALTVLNKPCVQ